MERIIYIILLAVVFLIFKAFFLDDYLKEQNTENNITAPVEMNESIVENNSTFVDTNTTPQIISNSEFQKKMDDTPLDRFFNSLADKLEDKL